MSGSAAAAEKRKKKRKNKKKAKAEAGPVSRPLPEIVDSNHPLFGLTAAEFITTHASQFTEMGLPDTLWQRVLEKLITQEYDILDDFEVVYVEDEGFELQAKRKIRAQSNVYILDHFWTTNHVGRKPQLLTVENLLDRCWQLMDMDRRVQKAGGVVEDLKTEQKADMVISAMKDYHYGRSYNVMAPRAAGVTGPVQDHEVQTFIYVVDEVGSAISFDEAKGNARMEHLLVLQLGGTAFSLFWPTKDIKKGDFAKTPVPPTIQPPRESELAAAAAAAQAEEKKAPVEDDE